MLLLPTAMLLAADAEWANKQVAEWSEDDAKQVLAESPWVKPVTPSIIRNSQSSNSGGGLGRGGNVGIGIPGFPGAGGGGRRGRGGPYPGGGSNNAPARESNDTPPMLTLRWESAMPVRAAELKARDVNAPTLEDENHYALAVYGIPAYMINGDVKQLADECKKKSSLSRDNKKDIKPSSVQILRREDGPVVVFLFLRTKTNEITKDDRRIEFDTQINRLSLTQSFYLEDMVFQGKTEL